MTSKRNKRIAIIIDSMNLGGAEKSAAILSGLLVDRGYQVYVFIDNHTGGTAYKYKGKTVWISKIETKNPQLNYLYRAHYLKELKKELKIDVSISFMEDYNIINVMSDIGDKKIVSVRTYLSSRSAEMPEVDRLYHKIIPRLYNKADKVVTLTKAQADDIVINYGVKREQVSIIPNITDQRVTSERIDSAPMIHKNSIVTIGRLIDVKAQWHSVRAMSAVVEKIPDAHLYLLGNGGNYDALRKMAVELGIEQNIHFEGFSSDVEGYLKQAKLMVHTSKAEGFVNALLDAFKEGIPVICADVLSSPRELLAPGTEFTGNLGDAEYAEYGVLVPKPDEAKKNFNKQLTHSESVLAEVLIDLLTDEKKRKYYAEKSLERAKDFSEENVISKWIKCIEE